MKKRSSVIIGQSSPQLLSKALETVGCRPTSSDAGPGTAVDVMFTTSNTSDHERVHQAMLRALVQEACGASKGVVKRQEGDLVIDSSLAPPTTAFYSIVKSLHFSFDDLPDDKGVAMIGEMTYTRVLRKYTGAPLTIVTDFPRCLCPDSTTRSDLVIGGVCLLSLRLGERCVLRIHVNNVDSVIGRMVSSDFVASILPKEWKDVSERSIHNLNDLLEDSQQAINDYWQDSPQNDRNRAYTFFLMTAVGSQLREYFATHTPKNGIFHADKKMAEHALTLVEDWISICERLTTIDWAAEWGQEKFHDFAMQRLRQRLTDVTSMRSLNDEIRDLIDVHDMRALRGDTVWDVFDHINVYDTSEATQERWVTALAAYNRRMEAVEHRCATTLRDFFAARSNLAPQAILSEFVRFNQLMKRPIVSRELSSERESLLAKLSERLHSISLEVEQRATAMETTEQIEEDRRTQAGRHMPGIINKVMWLRQVKSKVDQMLLMTRSMLADLSRSQKFEEDCVALIGTIEECEEETFKNWIFDIKDNSDELTLDANSKIMDITSNGKVEVNYSERLVELLREVRVFVALGFAVPREIIKMAEQGEKFYQSGVALKQVANTYNNMNEDIIESTRAILLEPALSFESVIVGGDRKLTWRNTEETERFIERLRKASGVLTADNRRLHRLHSEIGLLVLDLFKIDLLRSKDRWMGRVRQIRELINQSNFSNTDAWTTHWDMQIFKALEHQYQMGLESLHEVVNEIRVDVIYDANLGKAALRPPIEQVREQYYQRIKDFVTFPNRFTGVGGNYFFRKMPGMNERGILAVTQHAAALFKKIEKELKRFNPMLIIAGAGKNGAPSLEQIVEACLSEVQHWESNIRLLKQKGKEIASVENFIKIDCVTLSTAGIKGTVDEHLSKLALALNATLRKSAQKHLDTIREFLNKVSEVLDAKLTKVEEIGRANMMHAQFMEQRPTIEVEWHHFFSKNNLYLNMTGKGGIDYSKEKEMWDKFTDRLDSHEKEMEEQLNEMKAKVDKVVKEWQKDTDRFYAQWNELKPKDSKAQNAMQFITERKEQFAKLKEHAGEVLQQCKYFQMDEPEMDIINELEEDIKLYESMWVLADEYQKSLKELQDESWIAFRSKLFRFDDFMKLWQEKLKEAPSSNVTLQIRTQLDEWTRVMPLLKFVRGDGFTPNHWQELFRIIRISKNTTQDTVTFGQIMDKAEYILRAEKDIKQLHARAQGEAQIREALDDVRNWAADTKFNLVPHPERKGVMLITEWKDVMTSVNDNQALLFSMKDSPFFGPFSEDANKWESRLALIDELLHYMNAIQRKWVYLEPIFSRGALPQEQERFMRMDKEYYNVMKQVEADPKVVSLSKYPEYREKLKNIGEQLERCQKALNEFLEEKRDKFPRFYFISDDDLLEILGQSKNPVVIQSHLKKLFMGIHSVKFDKDKKHIVQIISLEGETVPLGNEVTITDEVEEWLRALDVEMKGTLQQHLRQCIEKLDVGAYASQILCTCEQIHFTKKTEEAFKEFGNNGLQKHKANLQAQLKELTTFSASNTDMVMELKLKALIMDLIHSIEVAELLAKQGIDKESDWLWRKQLRFYLNREGTCDIRMVDAMFRYSYEYQGNAPKLVHTPLTDRCYLTLTQGMHLGYGGNPYGPAGTGKTESVKALGNAMGRQVLVFNCDEGIDFKSMGRIFTGLVKCGAWGCFDEFNRLKVDQLSAVSQMIQVIQEALKQGERNCHLLGRDITVDSNAGIFVTLNPAGKHYGGRSKLPDNLKQLFRSVAMSVPDNELIAETILYSEGFENATVLAKKMVEIFRLSKQLLSFQQHYDWGLRAMKAVLRLGGVLVHQYLKDKLDKGITHSAEEVLNVESEIIIKSLRVNTLSKLTFDDVILFNNLITDVFPGVDIREIMYQELRPAILESIQELKLQVVDSQIAKILQLYEALNQRMGVVLVGPSGSGKTTLLRILRKALQKLGTVVPLYVMNPKAMPRNQLLGHMDMDTREWFDGVLTEAAKKVVKEDSKVRSWILCDGDIDPEWVESLNSVLDDNKLLTMPNGVRIQFGSNVNFIFETHTLQYASPATVSRMGMIFLSEEDVDAKIAVVTWLSEQPQDIQPKLGQWIEEHFYNAITTLLATKALVVETTRMGLVMSALSQLHGCTTKLQFAQGIIYGLGSYLAEKDRVDFAKDILYMVGERAPDPKAPLDWNYDPERGSAQSFAYERTEELRVEDLRKNPMINTVDCQRNLAIMDAWTKPHGNSQNPTFRSFILVGPEGCGKTMLLTNLFNQLPSVRVAVVNCSAQTVAAHVIQKLKQMCQAFNTNQGKVLRPKDAERLILLLKDLNLPKPDKYGTVQLHSFLQQLLLYQGFYDNDLEWVAVERLQIVGSMNPPGSMGRFPVAPRFVAIVSILNISYPSKDSLQQVYYEFLSVLLQSPSLQQVSLQGKGASDIARAITTVYEIVTKKYTVDDASHYIFNPRDLTNWVLSLLSYNLQGSDIVSILEYEGRRIFSDRLVAPDDVTKVDKVIKDNLSIIGPSNANVDDKGKEKAYVSWIDTAPLGRRKLCIIKQDELKKSIEESVRLYARENADLNVQLLPEVLSWVARADRVISQECGNILLVGRAGVCSQEIVRLVAYNSRSELFTLNMTREYNLKSFQMEIKAAIQHAGIDGQHTVLLLEDHNFYTNSTFLEMINSLLSAGEIPGLYAPEEIDAMLSSMKEDAIAEGFTDGVYSYFVNRIRRFLHVAVIMDPTNVEYELRCRSNPALFTRCAVCWLGTWGTESLKLVPRLMLKQVYKALDERPDKKEFSLTTELVHIHKNVGERYSPQDFKTLCATYEVIFNSKSSSSGESKKRLQAGLSKLAEAEANVDNISKEVTEKKALMETKQKEADEALTEIQKKMEESREQKHQIQKIQKDIDKEQAVVTEKKSVIEKKLSGIQPVLDAARTAVGSIKSEHISELKALKQPPQAVQDVLEGVLNLLGIKDTSWASIRKWLAGDSKNAILNFEVSSITPSIRTAVEKHLKAKENSFKPEVISRASKAAAPMAEWLKANIEYSVVLETVQPLNDELAGYTENLKKGQERMNKYEEKLKKVERKVDELKKNFGDKTKEAERLKDKLEQAENTLKNASELLGKLSGEKTRWNEQVAVIDRDLQLMPRRALIAAAFITYLGHEPEDVRRRIVTDWKEKLKVDEFNFFTFLRTESTMLQYKAEGLPGDELSMDNAVIIREQQRTALMVDPASQATEWFRNHLKGKNVSVEAVSISDERLVNTLELAIRFGKTLLITDVDRIEPFLYPLLRKELRTEGTKRVIQIGDRRSVDYADGFQLFMVTRSTDLRIPPDAISYLSEISFTITHGGLEGQLLGVTIQHEQPELEQEKLAILKNEESLKMQLAELEESLLRDLAASQGSLLENLTLIENLNKIKTQATEIAEALAKSKEVQEQLDEKRNVYRPLANTGSIMFFLIKNLQALNHMYQFSLGMFMEVFNRTLDSMKDSTMVIEEKITELSKRLGQGVVSSVSRALFKEHRTTFGIHLARTLNASTFSEDEWKLFVDRSVVTDVKRAEARVPNWVPPECKHNFENLVVLVPDLVPKMNLQESDVWYNWMRSAAPEENFPAFLNKVTPFQRLLIVKALRGDRLIAAMNAWACELLSVPYLSDNSTLASMVPITTHEAPVLLITTPGADPSLDLQTIAYETVGRERFHQLAMGGGQQEEGIRLLKQCAEEGSWLLLKNLHLVIPWVTTLQKELNLLKPDPKFRLWLTSEPHDEFPSILISASLKITFEAPPGIKQNLVRTYNNWDDRYWEKKTNMQTQLLFALAWLHATVLERRSYVPQGWAKNYEFSAADIKSASDIVIQQSQNNNVDWRSIHGVLESAIYGGRMETEYDVRILRTYLLKYFTEEVLATAQRPKQLYKGIVMPSSGKRSDFLQLVDSLPDSDVPAMFNLPPNADRVVQLTRVTGVITDLQRLQETKETSKMTRAEWAAKLQPLLNTWMELCQPHPDLLTHKPVHKRDPKPIEGFVSAEVSASVSLLGTVEMCISDLRKVIDGTILLSEHRRTESEAMLSGEVPLAWDGAFSGPERIVPWLTSLVEKAVAIRRWYELCSNNVLLKESLNLSHLFRPVTFLNALRQETSHLTREPLVELELASKFGSAPTDAALPICVTGMLLQGATVESDGYLAELTSADAPGFYPLPDIYIYWAMPQPTDDSVVGVPVYANATKETLLFELKCKCRSRSEVSKFILSGIAVMLEQ